MEKSKVFPPYILLVGSMKVFLLKQQEKKINYVIELKDSQVDGVIYRNRTYVIEKSLSELKNNQTIFLRNYYIEG